MGMKTIVRYKGEFDYHALYSLMENFFASRDFDLSEDLYKDKGNEMEFSWSAEREYDEFYKISFSIGLEAKDADKIRVSRGHTHVTLVRGRVQIVIKAELITDYNSDVPIFDQKTRFGSLMKKLHGRITEREIDEYWSVVVGTLHTDLVREIKQFFGMQDSGN